MNKRLVSIPSLMFAVFCVACGDEAETSTSGSGGGDSSAGGGGTGVANSAAGGASSAAGGTAPGTDANPSTGGSGSSSPSTGGSSPGTGANPGIGGTGGSSPGTGGSGGSSPSTGGTGTSTGGSSPGTGGTGGSSPGTGGSSPGTGGTGGSSPGTGGSNPGTGGTGGTGPGTGGTGPGTGGQGDSGSAGTAGTSGAPETGGTPSTGGSAPTEPEVITSSNSSWWQEVTPTKTSGGNASITVSPNNTHQTWVGFGGCFNEKGWVALSSLSADDRALALRLLFSKTEGAGFTMGRMPMGASDYALTRYTYNDTANDTSMSSFSIQKDEANLIPYIQAALEINPDLFIWGSPWTPPPWMKDNNAYDKGNMKGDAAILDAYALYFSKFISAYGEKGIKISAVAPQNEPGFPQDYPSCLWDGTTFKNFVNVLGTKLQTDAPDVEIWLGTMSATGDASIIDTVLGDATARGFVDGIGVQWSMMDQAGSWSNKGVPLHQTEHRCGNYPFGYTPPAGSAGGDQSKAPNDFNYGLESWYYIRKFINDGGHSYAAWNMVLDSIGRSMDTVRPWAQNAPLVVENGQLKKTPAYYVFRHAAQFVDPGAVRIDTSASDGFAFKNPDGDIVLVMQTNSAQTMTVGIGTTTLSFQGPGQGWVTVNYRPE